MPAGARDDAGVEPTARRMVMPAGAGHDAGVEPTTPRLRALVTNDDGIDAPGLLVLARLAVAAGLDAVVAAPLRDASGTSASLAAVQQDGRIVVAQRVLADLDGLPAYAVDAAPGFIALLAMRGAFGPPPQVVLSGVNLGANSGHAILHSGTVGAVLTAAQLGCRGMAVSLTVGEPLDWDTAASVAEAVLPQLLAATDPLVLNVNAPAVPPAQLRGLRQARLAAFGAVQTKVAEVGEGYVQFTVTDVDAELEPGTDAALLAEGFGTVTPLAGFESLGVRLDWLPD